MKREQKEVKLRMILQDYHRRNDYELQQAVNDILALDPLPPAEGAEEIIESIVESLGEPMNINNHIFEIRPYTVEHKTEWWIFHKEVGSGEPLAQWLSKFAALHAQKIADKMVEERLREELGLYNDWLNGAAGKYLTNPFIGEYLKSEYYLKSREQ